MESVGSEALDLIVFSDCLVIECLVFIFLASMSGILNNMDEISEKVTQSICLDAQGVRLLLCLSLLKVLRNFL